MFVFASRVWLFNSQEVFVEKYQKEHNHCGALYRKEEVIHLTLLE